MSVYKRDGYMLPGHFQHGKYPWEQLEKLYALVKELGLSPYVASTYLSNRVDGDTLSDLGMPEVLRTNIINSLAENDADNGDSFSNRFSDAEDGYQMWTDTQLISELEENEYIDDNDGSDELSPVMVEIRKFQATKGIIAALKEE